MCSFCKTERGEFQLQHAPFVCETNMFLTELVETKKENKKKSLNKKLKSLSK